MENEPNRVKRYGNYESRLIRCDSYYEPLNEKKSVECKVYRGKAERKRNFGSAGSVKESKLLFKIAQHRLRNAVISVVLSIIFAITNGCATIPATAPPSPEIRKQFGRIGVVALSSPIRVEFHTFPKGQTSGALVGAAAGALGGAVGAWAFLSFHAGTFLTPAAIADSAAFAASSTNPLTLALLCVLVAAALGVIYTTAKGATEGAAEAVPAETAQQIEQQIDKFLENMKLSSGLTEAIYSAAASQPFLTINSITLLGEANSDPNISYDNYSSRGIKTILEVGVTEAGFQGGTGEHPIIKFYMNARTRLVEAASDTELYTRDFQYQSSEQPFETWLENSGQMLALEFKLAQANLTERIIDVLFLANAADVASKDDLTRTYETTHTNKEKPQPQEEQKLASIPKDVSIAMVSLRRKPVAISNEMKLKYMLAEYEFFDRSRNPHGSFQNVFVDNNDGTVTDRATGLIWQMGGSSSSLDNRSAKEYVKHLNGQRFASYADWRMPTIEELASLIKKDRRNGVHIDPVFDNRQTKCWSVDTGDGVNQLYSGAWIVDFRQGQILKADYLKTAGISHTGSQGPLRKNDKNFLKAVRSAK
jgi:hypothetical protein